MAKTCSELGAYFDPVTRRQVPREACDWLVPDEVHVVGATDATFVLFTCPKCGGRYPLPAKKASLGERRGV